MNKPPVIRKAHGSYDKPETIATMGASKFTFGTTHFPTDNPLTASGEKVLDTMKGAYGSKKGKSIFYATMNKGAKGSSKWHKKR